MRPGVDPTVAEDGTPTRYKGAYRLGLLRRPPPVDIGTIPGGGFSTGTMEDFSAGVDAPRGSARLRRSGTGSGRRERGHGSTRKTERLRPRFCSPSGPGTDQPGDKTVAFYLDLRSAEAEPEAWRFPNKRSKSPASNRKQDVNARFCRVIRTRK
jgi:hypothetical protein